MVNPHLPLPLLEDLLAQSLRNPTIEVHSEYTVRWDNASSRMSVDITALDMLSWLVALGFNFEYKPS